PHRKRRARRLRSKRRKPRDESLRPRSNGERERPTGRWCPPPLGGYVDGSRVGSRATRGKAEAQGHRAHSIEWEWLVLFRNARLARLRSRRPSRRRRRLSERAQRRSQVPNRWVLRAADRARRNRARKCDLFGRGCVLWFAVVKGLREGVLRLTRHQGRHEGP